MNEPSLEQALQQIQQAQSLLEEHGISAEKTGEILEALQTLQQAQEMLAQARNKQFWDDAYELASVIKAGNKVPEIARFLRGFAEHIASHTFRMITVKKWDGDDITHLVDQIPELFGAIKEKEE